jgi:tetratricopeptide (TPR) repeat protein
VASLAELGAFAEGTACAEEEVRIAESVDQPASFVHASFSAGLLSLRKGDLYKAIPVLKGGLESCQIWNIRSWAIQIALHWGYAYALSGRVAEAVPLLEQAIRQNLSTSAMNTLRIIYLSEAYLLAGRRDEAIQLAEHTLKLARQYDERGNQAWALRLLGEIAARCDPPIESAEASYRQALALAEELGMRPLQAHSHRGLGILYTQIGRREQAHEELSTAIVLYRAMAMQFWLPQVEAALVQVT